MDESWIDIPDTNGAYSVSNLGRVRSNRYKKPKILKDWAHTNGYRRISLGRKRHKYVHRLVATCFVPNPNLLPDVDHVDGDRTNNGISNLRWVTAKQNAVYGGERHNWESQRIASAKRRIHDAKKKEYEALASEGYSLRHIARLFGTSHSAISNALKNY